MTDTSSTSPKRAAIIVNPAKPVDIDVRGLVAKHCVENGWGEAIWLETTKEDPGVGQAKEALAQGADIVIAAGGDGTVRCVAEVLAGGDIPMGLLPLGTGNLLARNLGMDVTDYDGAMAGALSGAERKIDVVRARRSDPDKEQLFLVMAGVGYDATIMADTNEDLKDKVGWLAYVDAGIRNLPGKPVKATVVIDGQTVVHRGVRSVMVGNCGKVQGNLEIFPDAKVDDGLLDIAVLAPHHGKLGWLSVLAGIIGKGRNRDTAVEYFQGKSVEITLEHADDYQLDGDHEGEGKHVLMTMEPGALTSGWSTTFTGQRLWPVRGSPRVRPAGGRGPIPPGVKGSPGRAKTRGPCQAGGNLEVGPGVGHFHGNAPTTVTIRAPQQLGHGERQLVRGVGDPGREAERPGLPVRHGKRGGGPHVRTAAAAVVQCRQQLPFTHVAGSRQHKLVQHAARDRVHVDAQDVDAVPGQGAR